MLTESSQYNIPKISCSGIVGKFQFFDSSILSNTRWISGRGTPKRSRNRSSTKERFIPLYRLVPLVDIASWLCDQHKLLKRNEAIQRVEAFWIYSHVNDITFDNRQFVIANILMFSRFDSSLDLPELHAGVGSVNNHLQSFRERFPKSRENYVPLIK